MSRPRFVLSTVGISMLLRSTDQFQRLRDAANERELAPPLRDLAEDAAARALDRLRKADVAQRRRLSAELNGLYGLYDEQFHLGQDDQHILLVTDTLVGELAGETVRTFLQEQGWRSVSIHRPSRLSTATADDFSQGMKALIEWCEKTVPGYKKNGYEVVFNLTGGFKSLQGYLNIIGMFYADRLVYIFEAANELLTIPRLPVDIDETVLLDHQVELALMAEGKALLSGERVAGIPDGLLETIELSAGEEAVGLSNWGLLTWNRVRGRILRGELFDFPWIRYSTTFVKDFDKATPQEREQVQSALAQVSALLGEHDGDLNALRRHGGLEYDNYTNKQTADGRPIGHFRLDGGRRASCVRESDGLLLMRRFGNHDPVNDNP